MDLARVSPFGAVPQGEPARVMSLAARMGEVPDLMVADGRLPATSGLDVALPPEVLGPDGRIVAPAELKEIQPPRLLVASVPEPSDIDADGQRASATVAPATVQVPVDNAQAKRSGMSVPVASVPGELTAAATTTVSVYTPAQISQAYGYTALPAATAGNKGAYQGSGQVIVIIDAYHSATTGADLNTFSAKFGLPACTLIPASYKAGAAINTLVTPPKAGDGCAFQVLYANSLGGQSATAPASSASWATEMALDVQWAHAMAPNAKIVLVEAASASGNDLMNAMAFASKLGASVISMSYGAAEFSSSPSYESLMSGTANTWVASSGDNGVGVSWPASSKYVLSVGGTALNNISPRAEVAWLGSGGGLSQYMSMPSWQSLVTVPGNPANTAANASRMKRGVPDVAYNASSASGFYIYKTGSGYLTVGGTSAGAPQWAALVSVINGARVLAGKSALSGTAVQSALYGTAAAAPNYAANFLDVSSDRNGSCSTCSATVGYDLVTGLGTPNVKSLVDTLVAVK